MSATIVTKMIIEVKNGDVFDEMRMLKPDGAKGKSNTGTYFLCSEKDLNNFDLHFCKCTRYYIDINKVREYQIVVNSFFKDIKEMYQDKMINFDMYCETISNSNTNKISNLLIRKNDTRNFLRFYDNNEPLVKALRHILYGEVTQLILEFRDNECYVYPEIKHKEELFFD